MMSMFIPQGPSEDDAFWQNCCSVAIGIIALLIAWAVGGTVWGLLVR